jgi:hypothetical protein
MNLQAHSLAANFRIKEFGSIATVAARVYSDFIYFAGLFVPPSLTREPIGQTQDGIVIEACH